MLFPAEYAIVINNAVMCWNRPWRYGCNRPNALPSGRAFLYIGTEEIFYVCELQKLWKLLIDKDMKKKDLCEKAGISPASVTKMGRNGHVTTEILLKICTALDCGIEDIMEIIPSEK